MEITHKTSNNTSFYIPDVILPLMCFMFMDGEEARPVAFYYDSWSSGSGRHERYLDALRGKEVRAATIRHFVETGQLRQVAGPEQMSAGYAKLIREAWRGEPAVDEPEARLPDMLRENALRLNAAALMMNLGASLDDVASEIDECRQLLELGRAQRAHVLVTIVE